MQQKTFTDELLGVYISENGEKYAVIRAGSSPSVPGSAPSTFEIYDLVSNKRLYREKSKQGFSFININEFMPNYIELGKNNPQGYKLFEFYDLKSMYKYSKNFTVGEWSEISKSFTNYIDFLKKYKFNQTKI